MSAFPLSLFMDVAPKVPAPNTAIEDELLMAHCIEMARRLCRLLQDNRLDSPRQDDGSTYFELRVR